MAAIPSSSSPSRVRPIAFWALRILLALAFLGAGVFKLSGHPAAVEEFAKVGLGQWFRYFTAATEMLGALLLLWPPTIAAGALLMAAVCVGAFFAQRLALHGEVIHTIVLGAILAAIAWTWRTQLASSLASSV